MKTPDIDWLLADLDALAGEDQRLDASLRVRARVMARWDERAARPGAALRWWSIAGLSAVATAVVLLSIALRAVATSPRDALAIVASGDGSLYRVAAGSAELLRVGRSIEDRTALRAGGGTGSRLALSDGSRVELRPRSELSLDRAPDGIRIRLASGGIIVHAAKRRVGRLVVETRDVTVSVVGTVFLVQAEEQGSRVAVIEGEVQVRHGATTQHLQPGQQVLTSAMLEPRGLDEEVAWSREAETLTQALQTAAQSPSPTRREFEAAAVRVSPPRPDGNGVLQMEGGAVRGGRYEINHATMVELISTAYEVSANVIVGGPSWLAVDRFDVIAKPEANTTSASLAPMLRSLLAERFGLAVRFDTLRRPAWVLAKGTGEPKLKPSARSSESGCQLLFAVNRMACRSVTIDGFIASLQPARTTPLPVINATGIAGSWDFDIDGVDLARGRGIYEGSPMVDAIDRQLGLTLAMQPAPQPVIVVERVARTPTPNAPDIETRLPPDPVEFEVASIRPCEFVNPLQTGGQTGLRLSPSGQVTTGCQPLSAHISNAWNLGRDVRAVGNVVLRLQTGSIAGAPRWMSSKYYNIVAKAPIDLARPLGTDAKFRAMLRNLLMARFKMVTHYEDRPVNVYRLVAAAPKLTRADPASRTFCRSTGIVFGSPTVVTCQNVTMAQFVEELNGTLTVASGGRRIVDDTGLDGSWDLTLSYRTAPVSAAMPGEAPEPTRDLPLPEAFERQLGLRLMEGSRLAPVFVIDHIEEHPSEN